MTALLRPLSRLRGTGLLLESYFWWRWIATGGSTWREEYGSRLDPARPLLAHVADYIRESKAQPCRILDVGAGPVTSLGYRLEGKTIEITAIDVLAKVYDRLWRRSGVAPPVRTRYADAERLTEQFERGSFDLVHAQNSLDHAANPAAAIEQMVQVTKAGCCVVLLHAIDEAVNNGYVGLHQWNFTERGGAFVIWNPAATINMTERLAPACRVRTERRGDAVFVEIRRLA